MIQPKKLGEIIEINLISDSDESQPEPAETQITQSKAPAETNSQADLCKWFVVYCKIFISLMFNIINI